MYVEFQKTLQNSQEKDCVNKIASHCRWVSLVKSKTDIIGACCSNFCSRIAKYSCDLLRATFKIGS